MRPRVSVSSAKVVNPGGYARIAGICLTKGLARSEKMTHYFKQRYQDEIVPTLMQSLGLDNVMEVPRLQKVVVNIGVGEALDNAKALDAAVADLTKVAGQKPIVTKARKSIANFKLREGRAIGVKECRSRWSPYH